MSYLSMAQPYILFRTLVQIINYLRGAVFSSEKGGLAESTENVFQSSITKSLSVLERAIERAVANIVNPLSWA